MFPIKYIDNNLVWNKDNEVFAYYELIPYNYSFLSAEQKFIDGRSAERKLRYCDAFGCPVDICRDITLLVMDIVGNRGDSSGCLDYQSSEIP